MKYLTFIIVPLLLFIQLPAAAGEKPVIRFGVIDIDPTKIALYLVTFAARFIL